MDILIPLFLTIVGVIIAGAISAFVALSKSGRLEREVRDLKYRILNLTRTVEKLRQPAPGAKEEPKPAEPPPPPPKPVTPVEKVAEAIKPPVEVKPAVTPAPPPPPPSFEYKPLDTPEPFESVWERFGASLTWGKIEEVVGKYWMLWGGVLLLFVGAGLFVKLAFDNDWIGPSGQIAFAGIVGVGVACLGQYMIQRGLKTFGHALFGCGLMILYVTLFCSFKVGVPYDYPPIPNPILVFSLMCVVTIVGVAGSLYNNALTIMFFALLGGFMTPVLVSTGVDARDSLFSYLLMLDLGVLAIAFYKKWRSLDVLAFVGTCILFIGWYAEFYKPEAIVPATVWLSVFYVIFLVIPFVYHVRSRTRVTLERFMMTIANAAFYFGYCSSMLAAEHSTMLAIITALMGVIYLLMGAVEMKRKQADAKTLFAFVALAVTCLAVAIPLYFELNGITIGWAVKGCVIVYLGYLFSYRPARSLGFAVLLLAVGRVFWCHWGGAQQHEEPFIMFFNAKFLILMCAPVGAAVVAGIHHWFKGHADQIDRTVKTVCALGAGLLFLTFVDVEIGQWFSARAGGSGLRWGYLSNCTTAILWSLGAVAFLAAGRTLKSRAAGIVAGLPLLVATVYVIGLYGRDPGGAWWIILNARFWAAMVTLAVAVALVLNFARDRLRVRLLAGAGLLFITLVDVEISQWFSVQFGGSGVRAGYLSNCTTAILWSFGTAAFLVAGWRFKSRTVRIVAGLPLLVSVVYVIGLYGQIPGETWSAFFNLRFWAAALAIAAAVALVLSLARDRLRVRLLAGAGYAAVLLLNVEFWFLIDHIVESSTIVNYSGTWAGVIIWTLAGGAGIAVAKFRRLNELYSASVLAFIVSLVHWLILYLSPLPVGTMMVLNMRFISGLILCAGLFAYAALMRLDMESLDDNVRSLLSVVYWTALGVPLILFSFEPHCWIHQFLTGDKARWLARMSITIVWALYGTAVLTMGFVRRKRSLRLAGLGLLALTSLKVVIMDLSGVEEVYRILSFVVLAVLMISSAYVYNKAEGMLKATETGDGESEEKRDSDGE